MKLFSNPTQAQPITWGRWIRLNAILLGLVCLVSLSFPVSTLSQKLNDFFFRLRRPLPTSSHVALVLIDDATLEQHGRWPWPRAELAKLIRAVSAQNPKAIGVDVLLPELEDEQNDSALTSAIQSAPNIVLATKISTSPTGNLWMDPLPRFAQAAKGVGHVQAIIDFDGLCRSIPVQEPSADGLRSAFALKLAELARPGVLGKKVFLKQTCPELSAWLHCRPCSSITVHSLSRESRIRLLSWFPQAIFWTASLRHNSQAKQC